VLLGGREEVGQLAPCDRRRAEDFIRLQLSLVDLEELHVEDQGRIRRNRAEGVKENG